MAAPQFLYKIIYQRNINYALRNINRIISRIIPSKVKIPPSGKLKLQTDSGTILMETNQTSYLTQLLFWNGYKSFEYSKIFELLAKDTKVFLDIGANIGYYSLLAAKSNPSVKAYAFEPALGPKHFLQKNIAINNFDDQITAINLALSNQNGKIDFFEVGNLKYKYLEFNLAGEGNAGTKTTTRNFIKNTVNATTLSEFVSSYKINKIDLIKIDTEGTEIDILKSGINVLKEHQPIVICETLFNTIEAELENFFNDLDYVFYNHIATGLKKVDSITRKTDDGIRNCFFVPKSKHTMISAFITN